MVYVVLAIIYALVIVIIIGLWGACTFNIIDCSSIGSLKDEKGKEIILKYHQDIILIIN